MTDETETKLSLTTEIMEMPSDFYPNTSQWPEYKRNVLGLIYLDEFDGRFDDKDKQELIEIPSHGVIDPNEQPQYQCIKCGKIQTNDSLGDIHRMKCIRCYNKAFNKIRPTKWVKFHAY